MRSIVTRVVFAVLVAVPAYLVGQATATPDYQKVMNAFMAAYDKGDASGIGAIYAADGLRVAPDGTVLSGRAAIQGNYGASLAGPMKGAKLKLTATDSRQLTPDILVVVGTWEITGGQAPISGKYINTMVRKDGQWHIAANMAMRPATPAPPSK